MTWKSGKPYEVNEQVVFHDEITGKYRKARILRKGKDGRQTYYVLDIDYGRIALPSELRRPRGNPGAGINPKPRLTLKTPYFTRSGRGYTRHTAEIIITELDPASNFKKFGVFAVSGIQTWRLRGGFSKLEQANQYAQKVASDNNLPVNLMANPGAAWHKEMIDFWRVQKRKTSGMWNQGYATGFVESNKTSHKLSRELGIPNPKFQAPSGEILEMDEASGRRLGLKKVSALKFWKQPSGSITVSNPKQPKLFGLPIIPIAVVGIAIWWLKKNNKI